MGPADSDEGLQAAAASGRVDETARGVSVGADGDWDGQDAAGSARINDEPWREAVLGRVPSTDTWVQWSLPWTVNAQGPVSLRVRAIDSNGVMQDQTRREPFPSGASGWHTVVVQAG